ncbi:MAG TPA: COX15/CtaA family protein [Methylomirabilota bacterium]|nr:COX15/CtaA family protein [Methylomirabilota bacterium]
MNANCEANNNHRLHRFAVLTAVATFLLLGAGGLVTSHEAGMSVPDWPNSYGYNMFAFPVSQWTGGIFYEHTHRLWASAVGLMTTMLAVWIWLKDSRKWMKWLGVIAFFGVVAQGILGGLRVTMKMNSLGIFHGVIAQAFFVLICAIAFFTSGTWQKISEQTKLNVSRHLRTLVLAATILVFFQLVLGATMRHQHAGLAISDFPLAHGQIWPDTNPDAIQRYNAQRMEMTNANPITAFQIILQMIHRFVAFAIFLGAAAAAGLSAKKLGKQDALTKFAFFWLALIIAQIGLGAWTIWSNKAADIATAHVLVGALSLVTGALWCIIAFRRSAVAAVCDRRSQSDATVGAFGTFAANK